MCVEMPAPQHSAHRHASLWNEKRGERGEDVSSRTAKHFNVANDYAVRRKRLAGGGHNHLPNNKRRTPKYATATTWANPNVMPHIQLTGELMPIRPNTPHQ